MSRTVTLLLIDHTGAPLGALPPFEVELPYWPEVWDVVAGARQHFGIDVTVLRLVSGERSVPLGGAVTYLAQTSDAVDGLVTVAEFDESDHPLRAEYGRPGGPQRSVDWAVHTLAGLDMAVAGAVQRKTWNLSSIWRLDTGRGLVWLKEVPAFFGHEPKVLHWLDGAGVGHLAVPLLAADGYRMLLDHVPGADLFGADLGIRLGIMADMHQIQRTAAGQVDRLLAIGVPDLRASSLQAEICAVVDGYGQADERLAHLVAGLAGRLAAVAACGVPETLVHGDLHPGNVRGDHRGRRIIDWGDSFVGHPAFDILRLSEQLTQPEVAHLLDQWSRSWRQAVPGCDPDRAVALLRPVAALRNAVTYARFLANIEPSEHPYHRADVPDWLGRAAELAVDVP